MRQLSLAPKQRPLLPRLARSAAVAALAPPRVDCCLANMSCDESMDEDELVINEEEGDELRLQGEPVTAMAFNQPADDVEDEPQGEPRNEVDADGDADLQPDHDEQALDEASVDLDENVDEFDDEEVFRGFVVSDESEIDARVEALRQFISAEDAELDSFRLKDSFRIHRIIPSTIQSMKYSSTKAAGFAKSLKGDAKAIAMKRKHSDEMASKGGTSVQSLSTLKIKTLPSIHKVLGEQSNGHQGKTIVTKKAPKQKQQQQRLMSEPSKLEGMGVSPSSSRRMSSDTHPPAKRPRLDSERRETMRQWTPSKMIYKPLQQGWTREVVYKQFEDASFDYGEPPDIIYYAPAVHNGSGRRAFTSVQDLSHYLQKDSSLSWHNFSFRREPMHAENEVIRGEHQPSSIVIDHGTSTAPTATKNASQKVQRSGLKHQRKLSENRKSTSHDNGLKLRPASALLDNTLRKALSSSLNKGLKKKKSPSLLRPKNTNKDITCSIHCPGVTGFPSLSCISCHSMFHPQCVGLQDVISGDDDGRDFLCFKCGPSNETVASGDEAMSKGQDENNKSKNDGNRTTLLNGDTGHKKSKELSSGMILEPGSHLGGTRASVIDGQTMVVIGGRKFLVVPNIGGGGKKASNSSNILQKKQNKGGSHVLPLMLKPKDDGSLPCFEVEETSDGKLQLLPVSDTNGSKSGSGNPFKNTSNDKPESASPPLSSLVMDGPLSSSYFSLQHIFKYLSLSDRVKASRVCRLWRDILMQPALNRTVHVNSCNIVSWPGFLAHVSRVRALRLDLRRLSVNKENASDTWKEVVNSLHALKPSVFATHIDLPRIDFMSLSSLLQDLPLVLGLSAMVTTVQKNNTTANAMHLEAIRMQPRLQELKLRCVFNSTRFETCQPLFNLRHLRTLSLLNCAGFSLADVEVIGSLATLEELELGDNCQVDVDQSNDNGYSFSTAFFRSVMQLKRLRSLRMERGLCNISIGELRWLPKLEKLELIDVELKEGFGDGLIRLQTLKRLLLIPKYDEEAASTNGEIVDTAMSMSKLSLFYIGVTNEWLETIVPPLPSESNDKSIKAAANKVPIAVDGNTELYSLSKLLKTLTSALPKGCKIKVLKMAQHSTRKQFLDGRK